MTILQVTTLPVTILPVGPPATLPELRFCRRRLCRCRLLCTAERRKRQNWGGPGAKSARIIIKSNKKPKKNPGSIFTENKTECMHFVARCLSPPGARNMQVYTPRAYSPPSGARNRSPGACRCAQLNSPCPARAASVPPLSPGTFSRKKKEKQSRLTLVVRGV